MIKPAQLKRGDHIAIVSLSGGGLGEAAFHHELVLGECRLREFGLEPVYMGHTLKGTQFLRNHPEERAADLKQAFFDDSIQGIMSAIGGDDTYRLLPFLCEDEVFIRQVRTHPKVFLGFSDTTINHLMFYKMGLATFYGPSFLADFAELGPEMLPYTKREFEHVFKNPIISKVNSSDRWYDSRRDFSADSVGISLTAHVEKRGYMVLRGHGVIRGKLLGGCLDSFYDLLTETRYVGESSVAAKYQIIPQATDWQNKILFIETSEEKPKPSLYEKMLLKLDQVGILKAVKGILVGKPQDETYFEDYQKLILAATAEYRTPILFNMNFGHAYPRTVLPYGALASIDLDAATVTIEEPYFSKQK
ncbi:MAG: LD-carboxypeptidase [Furfurilactobacillus sp.]|jgi:muramoyltetrapeptide carboxypeptidase LdcA involved in peptidoglycan recycling|uniref:S66 family peptidase n=1 Tax=Furfurilactobacillus TaxID=2767882 RepID=UPI001F300464|nr:MULTISPECIES: S66 peptidase family protein [Furfurilactobacillus]MCF6420572.1 LD-carboxypeptidase [Furfurilactobacillus milii]MCH4011089.1 LD-carboxypeptidase [Furfurilactobacillus sp.]MCH4036981.1 LD-carboxypeptidase [Furfurilactobacillus sp.]MCH4114073.1 LD-carboxypeptidase [Furfurilactobacillus sp.]MCH4134219.1 LD-carboxypeptidase [Furfurilactobacillus sp.]